MGDPVTEAAPQLRRRLESTADDNHSPAAAIDPGGSITRLRTPADKGEEAARGAPASTAAYGARRCVSARYAIGTSPVRAARNRHGPQCRADAPPLPEAKLRFLAAGLCAGWQASSLCQGLRQVTAPDPAATAQWTMRRMALTATRWAKMASSRNNAHHRWRP